MLRQSQALRMRPTRHVLSSSLFHARRSVAASKPLDAPPHTPSSTPNTTTARRSSSLSIDTHGSNSSSSGSSGKTAGSSSSSNSSSSPISVPRRFQSSGSGSAASAATESASSVAAGAAATPSSSSSASFANPLINTINTSIKPPPSNVLWSQAESVLKAVRPVTYSTLPNGFRIATEHNDNLEFVTIGVWIDAGSRFETRDNNGVAHFLEHMNFKGTPRFSKNAIDSMFESLGAHFNAYTSRDRTAYYIKVFNKDVDRVIDLLSDILQHGTYSSRYVELERPTILAEMREVEEIVEEVTLDGLHMAGYDSSVGGLPLTILGPTDNISRHINKDMIQTFVDTHYTGPRMAMVCCGGLPHDAVHALADKYFSALRPETHRPLLQSHYIGGTHTLFNNRMMAAHTHVAFPICGAAQRDAVALQLLQNLIGYYRSDMANQFAFQGVNPLRPPRVGLDLVKFFYIPYEETGLMGFQIIGIPAPENNRTIVADTAAHLLGTLQRLADHPPTWAQLEGAKATYKAAQLFPTDSTTNSAEDLGRQLIHFGRRVPLREVFEVVDSITPNEFSDIVAKYFDWTRVRPSVSSAGPPDALPQFDVLRHTVPWQC